MPLSKAARQRRTANQGLVVGRQMAKRKGPILVLGREYGAQLLPLIAEIIQGNEAAKNQRREEAKGAPDIARGWLEQQIAKIGPSAVVVWDIAAAIEILGDTQNTDWLVGLHPNELMFTSISEAEDEGVYVPDHVDGLSRHPQFFFLGADALDQQWVEELTLEMERKRRDTRKDFPAPKWKVLALPGQETSVREFQEWLKEIQEAVKYPEPHLQVHPLKDINQLEQALQKMRELLAANHRAVACSIAGLKGVSEEDESTVSEDQILHVAQPDSDSEPQNEQPGLQDEEPTPQPGRRRQFARTLLGVGLKTGLGAAKLAIRALRKFANGRE